MPRKYKKVKNLLPLVLSMVEEGKTQQEITDELGFDNKKVVDNLLYRARHPKTSAILKS